MRSPATSEIVSLVSCSCGPLHLLASAVDCHEPSVYTGCSCCLQEYADSFTSATKIDQKSYIGGCDVNILFLLVIWMGETFVQFTSCEISVLYFANLTLNNVGQATPVTTTRKASKSQSLAPAFETKSNSERFR